MHDKVKRSSSEPMTKTLTNSNHIKIFDYQTKVFNFKSTTHFDVVACIKTKKLQIILCNI